jgi:hypothetical protein
MDRARSADHFFVIADNFSGMLAPIAAVWRHGTDSKMAGMLHLLAVRLRPRHGDG